MFKVIRYFVCVEAGPTVGAGPFADPDPALALGQALARRGEVARVFSVTGEPVFDLWDEPRLLARYAAGNDA